MVFPSGELGGQFVDPADLPFDALHERRDLAGRATSHIAELENRRLDVRTADDVSHGRAETADLSVPEVPVVVGHEVLLRQVVEPVGDLKRDDGGPALPV